MCEEAGGDMWPVLEWRGDEGAVFPACHGELEYSTY